MREYVAYYTPGGRILSLGSLKGLEEELPKDRFIRTHKSYMVAIDKIETLEGNLLHIEKHKLPIGASYREDVLARIFQ
jgi:DNA-binding LytR/AlgR family response regulator